MKNESKSEESAWAPDTHQGERATTARQTSLPSQSRGCSLDAMNPLGAPAETGRESLFWGGLGGPGPGARSWGFFTSHPGPGAGRRISCWMDGWSDRRDSGRGPRDGLAALNPGWPCHPSLCPAMAHPACGGPSQRDPLQEAGLAAPHGLPGQGRSVPTGAPAVASGPGPPPSSALGWR